MRTKATPATRKPIVKLTVSDFRAFPIWEYAIDEEDVPGQDETWVRPVEASVIGKNRWSQLAFAVFETASGRKLSGFVDVTTANGKIDLDPGVIIGTVGYRPLPRMTYAEAKRTQAQWTLDLRSNLIRSLRLSEKQVFPLLYRLCVLIRGEKTLRSGVVR